MKDTLPKLAEVEFQRQVIDFAKLQGWTVAHFRPARTSEGWRTAVSADGAGWPDLFMVRGSRAVAAELKVGKRQATPEQISWLFLLGQACITAKLWYPTDWPEIEHVLGGEQ